MSPCILTRCLKICTAPDWSLWSLCKEWFLLSGDLMAMRCQAFKLAGHKFKTNFKWQQLNSEHSSSCMTWVKHLLYLHTNTYSNNSGERKRKHSHPKLPECIIVNVLCFPISLLILQMRTNPDVQKILISCAAVGFQEGGSGRCWCWGSWFPTAEETSA